MKKTPRYAIGLPGIIGVLAVSALSASASDVTTLDENLVAAIERVVEPWDKPDRPGVAVAVVRGGQVVFARGYGSADPERGVPVETDTLFDAASIAKTFTGLAVARLLADGTIGLEELDRDLRPNLDEIRELPSKLTLRHLLYHTSGLRDWPTGIELGGGSRDDRIEFDRVLRFIGDQRALNYPPGQRYSYTNSGYVLLARWLELRTGESFPSWMRKSIFEPLGMETTVIPRHPGVSLAKAAVGQRSVNDQWARVPRNSSVWGSSSMWTTALDLGRFMVELGERDAFKSLSFDFQMQAGKLADGTRVNYGAGVNLGNLRGRRFAGHGGSWSGFRSQWKWFPEEKTGVCVLSNSAKMDAGEIAESIARIVLEGGETAENKDSTQLTEEQRARLVGRYRFRDGFDLEIFEVHGALHARATGQNLFSLEILTPSELTNDRVGIRLVFKRPGTGPATGLVSHQHGEKTPAPRVEIEDGPKPAEADPEELRLVTGIYPLWKHKHVEFRIEDGALVSQVTGEAATPVGRLTRDRFLVDAYGAEFRFWRDSNGRATGVTYRGLDTKRLPEVDPSSFAPYVGTYRSPELATEYRIEIDEGRLVARHPRHGTIVLVMVKENQFFGTRWFLKSVTFEKDGTGARSSFTVTADRVANVVFERVP